MTDSSPLWRPRWSRAAALVALLVLGAASAAGAQSSPSLASPRIVKLTPRVVDLQPRVISVAPIRTHPNTFNVTADVLFAFDRSDLSSNAKPVLGNVVSQLHKARPGSVSIVGYTDSIGTVAFNLGLSQRRAESVESYLQSSVHNSGLIYHTKGLGEADPVAPNQLPNGDDNPAGRQMNRRVVITYTPT